MSTDTSPDKLSIVVYDHHFDKVHYALVMASAAAAIGRPVTLFFTMGACEALRRTPDGEAPCWADMPLSDGPGAGADRDAFYKRTGIASMEELFEACTALGVRFLVCEMGLRAKGLEKTSLREDAEIERSGMVTFLNDASRDGATLLI